MTEAAALAAAEWIGRGDGLAGELAARDGHGRRAGGDARRRSGWWRAGAAAGGRPCCRPGTSWAAARATGRAAVDRRRRRRCTSRRVWDAVVQPLEALNALARGAEGALAMIAAGPEGSLMPVPEMYMQKVIVAGQAAAAVDIDASVGENIRGVAKALGLRSRRSWWWWCWTGPGTRSWPRRSGPRARGSGSSPTATSPPASRPPAGDAGVAHDHRHRGLGRGHARGGRAALPRRRDAGPLLAGLAPPGGAGEGGRPRRRRGSADHGRHGGRRRSVRGHGGHRGQVPRGHRRAARRGADRDPRPVLQLPRGPHDQDHCTGPRTGARWWLSGSDDRAQRTNERKKRSVTNERDTTNKKAARRPRTTSR